MILNRYIYINQIVFKCVTSKKALNHFFECRCGFHTINIEMIYV